MKFITTINIANEKEIITSFYVVSNGDVSLISKETAKQLGVLKLGLGVNKVDNIEPFPKIKDVVSKLSIDPYVKPVQQPLRRVPIATEKQVEEKLDDALRCDIIEKVTEPSPWISPIVVTFKSAGEIRIRIDMRRANQAILRENYPIPTFELIMTKLRNSKYFSRLDLTEAYHQLELHEDSRPITTFITHKGLFRYKRLMFGVNSAVEIFQRTLELILSPCENCFNFLDDIIVFGSTEEEHDKCLSKVMSILNNNNVTLNKRKCLFKVKELKFLGHILSNKGINVDNSKVEAIQNFRAPNNKEELRSFLGLVSYVGKFLPNLGTETDKLRQLTKKETKFLWTDEHEKYFHKIKESLANLPTLSYFDPQKPTRLIADASPVALGAVLVQFDLQNNPNIISFASKSLSTTERRYSQTEKESLALVWGVERFYLYLAGLNFELETDHKPLEAIFKPTSKPPARIERWVLRLQAFKFKVIYRKGKSNIADPLSRLCKLKEEYSFDTDEEPHIFRIVEQSVPYALKISQIIIESRKDQEITDAIYKIQNDTWTATDKNKFFPFRMELTNIGSVLLRGNKIVIPLVLREQVLVLAHEGHPGETVMKRRLRAKVWWPTIDRETEKFVKNCRDCLLVSQPNKPPPMTRRAFPEGPWQCLSMDLMGPLPNKDMILVVIDYYSRFTEIRFLKSTISSIIIKHLTEMFSRFGIPLSIRSDNGRQFISAEIENFFAKHNINFDRSPPYWPQANGEVENMNKSILKRLKIAHSKGEDYQTEIQKFLLMYNTTPHGTTGKSPSELLFGRNIRDKLPSISDLFEECNDEGAKDMDIINKQKGKEREDAARNSKMSDVNTGDKVVVQKMIIPHKLHSRFGSEEHEVIAKKGNELTLMNTDGQILRRHSSHVKKLPENNNSIEQPVVNNEVSSSTSISTSNEDPPALPHADVSSKFSSRRSSSTNLNIPLESNSTSENLKRDESISPRVTPIKLKKKEGLWRTAQK